jgi:hypothetical protein
MRISVGYPEQLLSASPVLILLYALLGLPPYNVVDISGKSNAREATEKQ